MNLQGNACGTTVDGKQYTISHKHDKLYKMSSTILDETCCMEKANNQDPLELRHQ